MRDLLLDITAFYEECVVPGGDDATTDREVENMVCCAMLCYAMLCYAYTEHILTWCPILRAY